MDHYQEHDHLTIVSASQQFQGMGRMGRSWYGSDQSLMCSILLKEDFEDLNISLLPLLMAQSCHKVLSTYHQGIMIKWPNDLMINDKKLAGILVKAKMMDQNILAIVLGLGININQSIFDGELKSIATSMSIETNKTYDIYQLTTDIFNQFNVDLKALNKHSDQLIDYVNQYAYLKNQSVRFTYDNHLHIGIASHVNRDGKLMIHSDNTVYEIVSDEILKNS